MKNVMLLNAIKNNHFEMTELLLSSGRFDKSLFDDNSEFYQWLIVDYKPLSFIEKLFSIPFVNDNIRDSGIFQFHDWFEKDVQNFISNFLRRRSIKNIVNKF